MLGIVNIVIKKSKKKTRIFLKINEYNFVFYIIIIFSYLFTSERTTIKMNRLAINSLKS